MKNRKMGKQINFYLMPSDYAAVEKYLAEKNIIVLATPLLSEQLIAVPNLLKNTEIEPKKFYHRILLTNIGAFQPNKRKENLYDLDIIFSESIEFHACKLDQNLAILDRGRLYYQTGFYDQNGIWIEKNADFLKSAEDLFKWFRKNFKKSDLTNGHYSSPAVLEFVKNGGILKAF